MLVDEVGIEPGPELRGLQEAILHQDESILRREGGAELHPATVELPAKLDARTAPALVGRDHELQKLGRAVEAGNAGRGVAADGDRPSGIGKSRLAAALAGEAHSDGAMVLYVSFADAPQVVRAAERQATAAVRPTLLVLDDADEAEPGGLAELQELARAVVGVPTLVLVLGMFGSASPRDPRHDDAGAARRRRGSRARARLRAGRGR